jgi:hypothetical protein
MWGRLYIRTFCDTAFEYEMLPVRVVMPKCAMKPVGTFTVRGHTENKYSPVLHGYTVH